MATPGQPVRLLLVDDSRDLTDIFALMVRHEPGIKLVATLNAADAVLDTIATHEPNVVLIDLTMDGKPPLEAVAEAHERFPAVHTIVYSGHDDPDTIAAAARAGARGFASKHLEIPQVLAVVRRVASGEVVMNPR